MQATLTFLGSGTSMGVPTLGCDCEVCRSPDPRNRRTRPSVRIAYAGHTILIDTGPDFHAQALREGVRRVDAVLYTHGHADHILGMDDLRPLSFYLPGNLPLYADEPTARSIERIFDYTFNPEDRYPTSARVQIHRLDPTPGAAVELFGARFERIPVTHGRQEITGFRFGSAAYLTDMSDLPEVSLPLLQNLDVLIIDALRREPHSSHSHLEKSIAYVEKLKPRRAFFTHMSHDLDHAATEAMLPPHIRLAYDGLRIDFEIAPPAPMKIFRSLSDLPSTFGPAVVTIGNFDGVHRGHQLVLGEVIARARALNASSLAITFDPHPERFFRAEASPRLITPLARKLDLLEATGVDATLVLPFTEEFSRMSARQFAESVLRDGAHAIEVHEGENFRFGYKAEAGVDGLAALGRDLGFAVKVYAPHQSARRSVSSSRIRQAILDGDVSAARRLLGRPFSVMSTPAPGRGYGTRYTVPTINLAPYSELLPAHGVYVTCLMIGEGPAAQRFDAVTNVGNRPTFGADSFTVETHLLNFHPIDLSESTPLCLTFLKRLRGEVRWPTPEALKAQIGRDVACARRYFSLGRAVAARRPVAAHPQPSAPAQA